eukprot:3939237-Pyramimonas_sp.AAC.1
MFCLTSPSPTRACRSVPWRVTSCCAICCAPGFAARGREYVEAETSCMDTSFRRKIRVGQLLKNASPMLIHVAFRSAGSGPTRPVDAMDISKLSGSQAYEQERRQAWKQENGHMKE